MNLIPCSKLVFLLWKKKKKKHSIIHIDVLDLEVWKLIYPFIMDIVYVIFYFYYLLLYMFMMY